MWFKTFGLDQVQPICAYEGKEFFGDYYIGTNHSRGILAKFGVPFEVNLFFFFEVFKKNGLFWLRRKRAEEGIIYSRYRVAGKDSITAKQFMIEEILRVTMPNKFEDPSGEVKRKLEEAI